MIENKENSQEISTSKKPSWIGFPFGKLDAEISNGATVLMGHHLIVMAHNGYNGSSKLWAIDLRDNSVEEEKEIRQYYDKTKTLNYSFTKYGENQIIKYGGGRLAKSTSEMVLITIDSFKPLKVQEKTIRSYRAPALSGHTAEIYKDCLYVFGGRHRGVDNNAKQSLWCYDLTRNVWTKESTTGQIPKTMNWTKIKQNDPQPGQDSRFFDRLGVDIYGDNLLVLKNKKKDEYDQLYCCNRETLGSWSMIDVEDRVGLGGISMIGNLVVYQDALYVCVTNDKRKNQLSLAVLNLENVGLSLPRSQEEERLSSLFMGESESDIKFKIENKMIPAHKEVLIENCKFFDNLFNSGMVESRLDVIDIDDCEYNIFKEFLRFLYCGKINVDASQAMKLFFLADKYVQEDLRDKCVNSLVYNLTESNADEMLEFACENDIPLLKDWCLKIYKNGLDFDNLEEKVQDLKKNETEKDQLIEKTLFEFVLENLSWISREKLKLYEDLLRKNITKENILRYIEKFSLYQEMTNLQDALLKFVSINFPPSEQEGLAQRFRWDFGKKFEEYKAKKIEEKEEKAQEGDMTIELTKKSVIEESQKDNSDRAQRKAIKRMDPTDHSTEEEEEKEDTGPILKKNK